jgi:hypothetical protein
MLKPFGAGCRGKLVDGLALRHPDGHDDQHDRQESFALLPVTIDLRGWTPTDVLRHPGMSMLLVRHGKAYLLPGGGVLRTLGTAAGQAIDQPPAINPDAARETLKGWQRRAN